MTAIAAATAAASSASASTKSTEAGSELGQNAFLKLMIAQLQDQDPLEPSGSDTEYVSELASFTELEQMTNLASAGEVTSAMQMIGHTATYANAKGVVETGTVESMENGKEGPTLTINGVAGITESSVTEVS